MTRLMAVLMVGLALMVAGCGNKTKVVTSTGANGATTTATVPDVHFAKAKFVLHAGLAFGAFHRYVYKPFRRGAFAKGASGRAATLVKAGASALFALRELKQARRDAQSDDRLRPLSNRLDGLGTKLASLGRALKGGVFDGGAIAAAEGAVGSLTGAARGAGASIADR